MKKDTISLQVPEDLKAALETKAKAEELNLSQLCRRILKQHVAAATATNPPPASAPASVAEPAAA